MASEAQYEKAIVSGFGIASTDGKKRLSLRTFSNQFLKITQRRLGTFGDLSLHRKKIASIFKFARAGLVCSLTDLPLGTEGGAWFSRQGRVEAVQFTPTGTITAAAALGGNCDA